MRCAKAQLLLMQVECSLSVMSFIPYIDAVKLTRRASLGARGTDQAAPPPRNPRTGGARGRTLPARRVLRGARGGVGAGPGGVGRAARRPAREAVASRRGCGATEQAGARPGRWRGGAANGGWW